MKTRKYLSESHRDSGHALARPGRSGVSGFPVSASGIIASAFANIRDVLDAYTINGANGLRRGAEIGSLVPGKSADFIIVDQDILALADARHADRIGQTRVLETWFRGKRVYAAGKHAE